MGSGLKKAKLAQLDHISYLTSKYKVCYKLNGLSVGEAF